jgi:type II secretory pathway pseudopilin PulG
VTARDRTVLIVVGFLAMLAAFWFLALSPKRKDADDLSAQLTVAHQRLDTAQANATSAATAKERYADDYATVARLGKAVPVDDDVPSLVYQLEATAKKGKIDFRSIKLNSTGTPTTASSNAANLAQAAGSTTSSTASASAAPAVLPPGATVGSAGFPTMPFTFDFQGSFFNLQRLLGAIDDLTTVDGDHISVTGRLLSVDGVQLKAAPEGYPRVDATVSVTSYLVPETEGLTAGATPAGPAASTSTSSTATASMIGSN